MKKRNHAALRVFFYSLVITFTLFFGIGSYVQAQFISSIETMIFTLTNQERQSQGVSPLTRLERLENMARQHSEEMALLGYISHTSPVSGYEGQAERAQKAGVTGWAGLGENISWQYDPFTTDVQMAQTIFNGWMSSEGHRKNILDSRFTHLGVGVYRIDDEYYATQNFAFFQGPPPDDNIGQHGSDTRSNAGTQSSQTNFSPLGGLNYFSIPIGSLGSFFGNYSQFFGSTSSGGTIGNTLAGFRTSFGNTMANLGSLSPFGTAYGGGFSTGGILGGTTANLGWMAPASSGLMIGGGYSSGGTGYGGGISGHGVGTYFGTVFGPNYLPTSTNFGGSLSGFGFTNNTNMFGTIFGGVSPSGSMGFGTVLTGFGGGTWFGNLFGGGIFPNTMNFNAGQPGFSGAIPF